MIRTLLIALCLALLPGTAMAHKVIMGVFPSGAQIEGELGFSNGDPAVGVPVEVFDGEGLKLGETQTDEDGFFLFAPAAPVTHVFRADLGAGHVAEVEMAAEEVAELLPAADPPDRVPVAAASAATAGDSATISYAPAPAAAAETVPTLDADEIARIVREEMRPLRQEIAAYKEKNDMQTVLGGIGYIVGLFGLGFYVAARRKLGASA